MTNIGIIYAACVCLSALVLLLLRQRVVRAAQNERLKAFFDTPLFWVALAVAALLLPSVVLSGFRFFAITAGFTAFDDITDQTAAIRNLGLVVAAFVGVPFVVWRSVIAQKQVDVSEQGQITDRITRAVEGLGAEKLVKREGQETSEPNIEVRIGAIYALERIAQDSDRDHVQIMEILCAYIRGNAPAKDAAPWTESEISGAEVESNIPNDWIERINTIEDASVSERIREDVQTALMVIGRRSARQRLLEARNNDPYSTEIFVFDIPPPNSVSYLRSRTGTSGVRTDCVKDPGLWWTMLASYTGYRLDLSGTNLRGANLSGYNLNGANLCGAEMQRARLVKTQMRGAWLFATKIQQARLDEAQMQGARLFKTEMQGAMLKGAEMENAWLEKVEMNERTILTEVSLTGACVKEMDEDSITKLKSYWRNIFGDLTARTQETEDRPGHWEKHNLGFARFLDEWQQWQRDLSDSKTPTE